MRDSLTLLRTPFGTRFVFAPQIDNAACCVMYYGVLVISVQRTIGALAHHLL